MAQVAQGQADITQAQSNLTVSEAQFYQVTGTTPDNLVAIKQLPAIPNGLDEILAQIKNHPALMRAKYEMQAAEKQYALTKRELWPTVMLTSRAGKQDEASYIGSESNNQNLRYAGDLRVDHNYRGKSLVKVLAKHVKQTMHAPNFSQMIIFDDNHAARAAIQTGKTGMPDYYDEGLIETLSLTSTGSKRKITAFLKQTSQQSDIQEIRTCIAEAEHVPAMNQFIADMAEHYNFIPAYNFEELAQGHQYFLGMKLSDFSLYFKGEKLVGMFGLWDQHSIKQTKILNYSSAIGVLRPIYNLLTPMTKGMRLPKLGDSIQYHVLHTLMCHPEDLALHHKMLQDAYNKSKQQGVGVVSFTLSHKDPRYQLNQFYKGERLTGMHGFISYEGDPRLNFDKNLIPYLEVGRI